MASLCPCFLVERGYRKQPPLRILHTTSKVTQAELGLCQNAYHKVSAQDMIKSSCTLLDISMQDVSRWCIHLWNPKQAKIGIEHFASVID